ncbi:unnamed protein product, partial [Staurois parvus]
MQSPGRPDIVNAGPVETRSKNKPQPLKRSDEKAGCLETRHRPLW